jgi:4-diphosphocytidyl-2-C-methyl-D-erythritol kinase
VACPAKVNLFLEVLGRRPDGFHGIESVLAPAPWGDRVEAAARPGGGVSLEIRLPSGGGMEGVPADGTNLAARAARLALDAAGAEAGVRLVLHKEVPPGAGLGGGSSDAAGALLAVNRLLGSPLPRERLEGLALSLGSDVPYFLEGGFRIARGRGEVLSPAPAFPGLRLLVLWPGVPVPTAEVYARCRPAGPGDRRDPAPLLAALAAGDAGGISRACFNRLEGPALEVCPRIGEALEALRSLGAGEPRMTGSGSAAFLVLPPGASGRILSRRLPMPGGWRVASEA